MKKVLSILLLFASITAALAQNSIRVEAPNLVASDEQFNVTFVIEGDNEPSDFQWNQGPEFTLVWGPQKGTSTSIQIINGRRSKSSQTTFTYVLVPKKTGSFQLPAATASVEGRRITSGRFSISVATGQNSSSSSSAGASSGSTSVSTSKAAASGQVSGKDLFLRLSLNKTNVVLGEPINAVLKLYQRVDIAGFEDAKFPTFTGFWSQTIQAPTNIEFQREQIDGKIYNAAVIRSYVLIPQQAGTLTIEPAELMCLVNVRTSSSTGNSVFDSFFGDDYTTIRKRVTSTAYRVHVSSLPGGAPASFGGGVGNFNISAKLTKDAIKTHDAASLVVTVSGHGNVSLVEAPKVKFPSDFEVYDTKTTQNTDKSGTSGSKSFEYPFIPRSHGKFTIEPIEYTYYDISSKKYVTLHTAPIDIDVAKGSAQDESRGTFASSVDRNDVKDLGNDIRFIVTKMPSFSSEGKFFLGSVWYWVLLALLIVGAGCSWIGLRKLAVRRADVVGNKNRKATQMARKRLHQAGDYLKQNLYTAYYEELHKALLGFISDKLNMSVEDLNKDSIAEALKSQRVADELIKSFTDLLDSCEYARYAPDAGQTAMSADYDTAVNVITSIDASMKGKKVNMSKPAAMLIALLLMVPGMVNASAATNKDFFGTEWTKGTQAYDKGNWKEAVNAWQSISKTGVESTYLYYNLGNAYFKAQDYPNAILNYERSLKVDPSNSDARYNLEFANSFIQDKIDPVPEFILKTWAGDVCYLLSSNVWTVLFFVFFILTIAAVIFFRLSRRLVHRRWGFYSAIVLLILALSSLGFASWEKADYVNADAAIVMTPVSSVKSSPSSEASKDLFVLHEGTKVKLLDEVGDWKNIQLADGRQGWVHKDELEVI